VLGAGTSRSQPEERGKTEGVLDPLAEVPRVTPRGRADLPVFHEQALVLAAQEVSPLAMATPGQAAPLVPLASEAEAAPKPVLGQLSTAPAGAGARGASPQARLALVRSGYVSENTSVLIFSLRVLILLSPSFFSKRRQGSAGLAARKALKTGLTSAADAAACHAGWLAFAQDAPERGRPRQHELPWG
jgi:hypothetical protein